MNRMNLSSYLKLQQPFLSKAVVEPAAYSNLLSIAEFLPPVADTILEFRLNRAVPDIDLSLCLKPSTPSYNAFIREKGSPFLCDPVWRRLINLMVSCTQPATLLQRSVDLFWLEFDAAGGAQEIPLPGYYIDVSGVDLKQRWASPLERADHFLRLAQEIHHLTLDLAMPDEQAEFLRHCLVRLPMETVVAYLGNMIPRGSSGIRFAVRGLQPATLRKYLQEVEWKGDVSALLGGLEGISSVAERVVFNFEVHAEMAARVDIESLMTPPNAVLGWPTLLDRFADRGYCSREKRDALLAWPGYLVYSGQSEWPDGLRQGMWFSGAMQPFFHRSINHLKLIYRPEQPFEAKVYLACQQLWMDVSTRNRKRVSIAQ
jgi:hypothetical protein